MNAKQQANEDKIFKAIRELKDSVFGLKQSYTPFCYTRTGEEGETFSMEKMEAFSAELTAFGKQAAEYTDELELLLPAFFRAVLMLLDAICSSSDWVFVSIRKLAETALKNSAEEESTLDRIVKSYRGKISVMFPEGEFWTAYEQVSRDMGRVDNESFYRSVKHALEAFLDEHRLNVLDRDSSTDAVVARMYRLAASVERDLARILVSEESDQ